MPAEFLQGLRTNLVTVNDSLKHHSTSTKRTKKNAGIDRSKKKKTRTNQQQKRRKRNRPTPKEQKKKDKGRNCIMLNRKKKRKRRTNQQQKEKKKKETVSRSLVQNTSISLSINIWVRQKGFKLIIMVKALVLMTRAFLKLFPILWIGNNFLKKMGDSKIKIVITAMCNIVS